MNEKEKLILTLSSRENNEEESFELGLKDGQNWTVRPSRGRHRRLKEYFVQRQRSGRALLCSWKGKESQLTGAGVQ